MVHACQQKKCIAASSNAAEYSVSYPQPFIWFLNNVTYASSEKENDLERKYSMLNRELRAALSVEDWRKSSAQRERESLLIKELVDIVDKRNELVQHLHCQEQA